MKLFMVLYIAGEIIGISAPLPYSFDECRLRAIIVGYDLRLDPDFAALDIKCEWR